MMTQQVWTKTLAVWMLILSLCNPLYASFEEKNCTKTCLTAAIGTLTSSLAFLGLAGATCSAGVCPLVVASSATGLFTASSLGAIVAAALTSAGEACENGISLPCTGYVALPAILGGVSGYLILKGYDRVKAWQLKTQNDGPQTNDTEDLQFLPTDQIPVLSRLTSPLELNAYPND